MALFNEPVSAGGGIQPVARTDEEKAAAEKAASAEPKKRLNIDWGVVVGITCVAVAVAWWLWSEQITQMLGL